mmetsp:Transcript_12098/g.10708  ORF Transcript_12098/g.10708 Transcript_12098/m.10708 type:complete len:182 (-) Transcript_12098:60-605(-)
MKQKSLDKFANSITTSKGVLNISEGSIDKRSSQIIQDRQSKMNEFLQGSIKNDKIIPKYSRNGDHLIQYFKRLKENLNISSFEKVGNKTQYLHKRAKTSGFNLTENLAQFITKSELRKKHNKVLNNSVELMEKLRKTTVKNFSLNLMKAKHRFNRKNKEVLFRTINENHNFSLNVPKEAVI